MDQHEHDRASDDGMPHHPEPQAETAPVALVVGGRAFPIEDRPVAIGGKVFRIGPPDHDGMLTLGRDLARLTGLDSPTPDQCASQLFTPAGCRLLAYTLTRLHHPTLKPDAFGSLITDDSDALKVLGDLLSPVMADGIVPLPPDKQRHPRFPLPTDPTPVAA